MIRTLFSSVVLTMSLSTATAQEAQGPTITADEWRLYRDAFVTGEGRVVDTANGDVSHSESQGYGLLLSVLAGDRASFERIWSFTRTELMIRDDGLAAWLWDPEASPHITDINNATDGDILIAYALARAGQSWNQAERLQQAGAIARALAEKTLVEHEGRTVILPGVEGFSAQAREDGPIVNPSYWIFEAFPVLDDLVPDAGWGALVEDGSALLADLMETEAALPSDWMALGGGAAVPAEGFPPEFAYNNIRIPLYLMRAEVDEALLARYGAAFGEDGAPARIDVATGERLEEMTEPGYRLLGAATACVLDGALVPADLASFQPTTYYAATLQLLALDYLRRVHPHCLVASDAVRSVPS